LQKTAGIITSLSNEEAPVHIKDLKGKLPLHSKEFNDFFTRDKIPEQAKRQEKENTCHPFSQICIHCGLFVRE
jgi:hypothetical protein